MAISTPKLGLAVWDLGSDLYQHIDLADNWSILDDSILDRNGDTAVGTITGQTATGADVAFAVKRTADAEDRVQITSDGFLLSGGATTPDVSLLRSSAGIALFTGALEFDGPGGVPQVILSDSAEIGVRGKKDQTQAYIDNKPDSMPFPLFSIRGDGRFSLGSGSSSWDTHISRIAPSTVLVESDLIASNIFATDSLSIGGYPITISGGGLTLTAPLSTAGTITARAGHPGQVRLGNESDPNSSTITFGPDHAVGLFRDNSQSPPRLRTNQRFYAGALNTPQLLADQVISTGLVQGATLNIGGAGQIAGNLNVVGSVTGSGGSFSALDVRSGQINATSSPSLNSTKHFTAPSITSPGTILGSTVQGNTLVSTWDAQFRHVYVNDGFVQLAHSARLRAYGGADIQNGLYLETGDARVNGSISVGGHVQTDHVRAHSGVTTFHNAVGAPYGINMHGQNIVDAFVIATQNLRYPMNDAGVIDTASLRLVAPVGKHIDLNGGTIIGGGLNTNGANINLGGGQIVGASDVALKTDFAEIGTDDDVLRIFRSLDVKKWRWKDSDESYHAGPTLQEFERKFGGLGVVTDGEGEKYLSMMDMIGLLYKAVQVLSSKIGE